MKNEVTVVNHSDFGLEEKQAKEITKGLSQILEERKTLEQSYNEVIQLEITQENLPRFKDLRLRIRDNRTKGIEAWHKVNKEYYLRGGQFVDAIKRKEVAENERMEANLKSNEDYFENLEKQRLEQLQKDRVELLSQYVEDAHERDLSSMEEDVWNAYLSTKKKDHEDRIKAEKKAEAERLEQERLAELARIEREKEIEAQRIENERLKKEAEEKEKALELERQKAKAEADKKEAQRQAELKAERDKQAKLEAELQAKKDAEQKAEQERLAKIEAEKKEAEKLAKAPIKKQCNVWVNSFEIGTAPTDNEATKAIIEKFEAFKNWSLKEIEKL